MEASGGRWQVLEESNLLSNRSSSRSEDVTARPALAIVKLGSRHVVSIVSIFGFFGLMKHHYVMSKKSRVFGGPCARTARVP